MKNKREENGNEWMMWLNWSVATINATLQFLDIYRYKYRLVIAYHIKFVVKLL